MSKNLLEKIDVSASAVLSRAEQKNIVGGQWFLSDLRCMNDADCPLSPYVTKGYCYLPFGRAVGYCYIWTGNEPPTDEPY